MYLFHAEAVGAARCAARVATSTVRVWGHRHAWHEWAKTRPIDCLGRGEAHGTNSSAVVSTLLCRGRHEEGRAGCVSVRLWR